MEGDTKITSVEKEKLKDPKRVEQGKRLAAISREAKERKARERAQESRQEVKQQQHTSFFQFVRDNSYNRNRIWWILSLIPSWFRRHRR